MDLTRTISVTRTVTDISSIDLEGNEIHLGVVYSDEYGQSEAKKFLFEVSEDNPWSRPKIFSIGVGSANLSFVNPKDAQEKVLQAGFLPATQYAYRGGLRIVTTYYHPDYYEDHLFDYDLDEWVWRGMDEDSMKRTFSAIQVSTDLQTGHMAVSYTPGFYRLICTNGLTSSLLEWEPFKVRHVDWDTKDLGNRIASFIEPVTYREGLPVTSEKHLQKAVDLLSRYWDELSEGELSPQMQLLEQQFVGLSKNVLKGWAVEKYIQYLKKYIKKGVFKNKDVHMIHLINAYTNSVNSHRLRNGDRGILSALDSTDNVVNTTASLANISAIFS